MSKIGQGFPNVRKVMSKIGQGFPNVRKVMSEIGQGFPNAWMVMSEIWLPAILRGRPGGEMTRAQGNNDQGITRVQ